MNHFDTTIDTTTIVDIIEQMFKVFFKVRIVAKTSDKIFFPRKNWRIISSLFKLIQIKIKMNEQFLQYITKTAILIPEKIRWCVQMRRWKTYLMDNSEQEFRV